MRAEKHPRAIPQFADEQIILYVRTAMFGYVRTHVTIALTHVAIIRFEIPQTMTF